VMTATPGERSEETFGLEADDYGHPILSARWSAVKPARLVLAAEPKAAKLKINTETAETEEVETEEHGADLELRVATILDEVERGLDELRAGGIASPAFGVVVNRVARARAVFERLKAKLETVSGGTDILLLIGPARPIDRDDVSKALDPIRTGAGAG